MSATAALSPELTKFDRRVLAALEAFPEDWLERIRAKQPLPWLTAWEVGEILRHDDVAEVRRVLRGLVHFGYATSRGCDHRQKWIRNERGDELLAAA